MLRFFIVSKPHQLQLYEYCAATNSGCNMAAGHSPGLFTAGIPNLVACCTVD